MRDNYTAEQYDNMADMLKRHAGLSPKTRYDAGKLLRQAAQMKREREVGVAFSMGKLTLAVIGRKHFGNPIPKEWYAAAEELIEPYTARRAAVPDEVMVSLNEIRADINYLFCRVAVDGSFMRAAIDSVRIKLDRVANWLSAAPSDGVK